MLSAVEKLKAMGIRVTRARVDLLKFLSENRGHYTAEDIFSRLVQDYPNLNLTSIYNNLKLFESKDIIKRLHAGSKGVIWDINGQGHAHFICNCCGDIYDLELQAEPKLKNIKNIGSILSSDIILRGLCTRCKKRRLNESCKDK